MLPETFSSWDAFQPWNREPAHTETGNLWFFKKSSEDNGHGITIFRTPCTPEQILQGLHDAKNRRRKKKPAFVMPEEPLAAVRALDGVFQRGVQNLLLWKGRKFDLRVFVSRTASGGLMVFNTAAIRTSKVPYDPASTEARVQMTHATSMLPTQGWAEWDDVVLPRICRQLLEMFRHVEPELEKERQARPTAAPSVERHKASPGTKDPWRVAGVRANPMGRGESNSKRGAGLCHESFLFGVDFIVDQAYQPYVLEVNTSPQLMYPKAKFEAWHAVIEQMTVDFLRSIVMPSLGERVPEPPAKGDLPGWVTAASLAASERTPAGPLDLQAYLKLSAS